MRESLTNTTNIVDLNNDPASRTLTCPNPLYLLLENPSKSNNLGPILRCAAAYAIHQVIFVGYEKCSVEGSHGASKHLKIISFPTFEGAVSYLKNDCNVCCFTGIMGGGSGDAFYEDRGVEVKDWDEEGVSYLTSDDHISGQRKKISYPIHIRPFQRYNEESAKQQEGNYCFVVSKNARGLPLTHSSICNTFVHVPFVFVPDFSETTNIHRQKQAPKLEKSYIPPYRFIDVQSCLSIVLHHYTSWQKYDERTFQGYKFNVDEKHQRLLQQQKERNDNSKSEKRKQEKLEANKAAEDALDGGLFDSDY